MTFKKELEVLLNSYSKESENNTPDFILAKYLLDCLDAFTLATNRRAIWYNKEDK